MFKNKWEKYTLMDLPVDGEQSEPGPIFADCSSHELHAWIN